MIYETLESTTTYARSAMKKLRSLNPKRLAVEFEESPGTPQPVIPTQTVTPAQQQQTCAPPPSHTEHTPRIQSVEDNIVSQNQRLTHLEKCCGMHAESSKIWQKRPQPFQPAPPKQIINTFLKIFVIYIPTSSRSAQILVPSNYSKPQSHTFCNATGYKYMEISISITVNTATNTLLLAALDHPACIPQSKFVQYPPLQQSCLPTPLKDSICNLWGRIAPQPLQLTARPLYSKTLFASATWFPPKSIQANKVRNDSIQTQQLTIPHDSEIHKNYESFQDKDIEEHMDPCTSYDYLYSYGALTYIEQTAVDTFLKTKYSSRNVRVLLTATYTVCNTQTAGVLAHYTRTSGLLPILTNEATLATYQAPTQLHQIFIQLPSYEFYYHPLQQTFWANLLDHFASTDDNGILEPPSTHPYPSRKATTIYKAWFLLSTILLPFPIRGTQLPKLLHVQVQHPQFWALDPLASMTGSHTTALWNNYITTLTTPYHLPPLIIKTVFQLPQLASFNQLAKERIVKALGKKKVTQFGGGDPTTDGKREKLTLDSMTTNRGNTKHIQDTEYLGLPYSEKGPISLVDNTGSPLTKWQPTQSLRVLRSTHPLDQLWHASELQLIKEKCQLPRE